MSEPVERLTSKPRLYHTPSSYYSMVARLALAEGGIAYEPVFVDIHFRMSQQQPDYVRLNPNMTVPTLVLADRILGQSREIAEYGLGVSGGTVDGETKAWLDLHYAYPIEELTFGGLLARNPVARMMVPRRLAAIRRRLLRLAAENPDLAAVYQARASVFAERARIFDPHADDPGFRAAPGRSDRVSGSAGADAPRRSRRIGSACLWRRRRGLHRFSGTHAIRWPRRRDSEASVAGALLARHAGPPKLLGFRPLDEISYVPPYYRDIGVARSSGPAL